MNRDKKCTIVMTLVFLATLTAYGQEQANSEKEELSSLISRKMATLRKKGEIEPIRITDERLEQEPPEITLRLLEPYKKDRSHMVRRSAFGYQVRVANLHPKAEIRQQVVENLVKCMTYPNDKLSGTCYKWLRDFTEKDFNNESKTLLSEALAKKRPHRHHVLICGVANITQELPRLKELLIDEVLYRNDPNNLTTWYYTLGWKARLARARMGAKEDIEKIVSLIEKEIDLNNNFLLLHDLEYIRQPKAIDSLKKYFESELRLPSINPRKSRQPYSFYIMHILADCLENYPVKKKVARNYTQQEIDLCRQWMNEQTEWEIIR